ncbi:MAG: AAA family ATPase [Thaumarchaeota archaeon]|nr:AAA family ATPase [Nitrososphaerota archaeon]
MQKNMPSLTLNFDTTYIKTLFEQSHCSRFHIDDTIYLTNRDKQYVMNAIKELSRYSFTGHSSFWTLLAVMLENRLCFISEHRPSLEELANNLFDLKNKEPLAENYDKLKQDFQKIFQSIEFDVYEEETSALTGKKRYVVIKEGSKRVRLHESASGYFEALYMLSLISAPEHPILILDEPALHLHQTKITLLSKILMDKKDVQTIIVTHSPYFVDLSLLQGTQDRRLIYVRKDDNESTVIAPTNGFAIQRHEFRPEVFFSNSVLLVEGPADHATVIAISELKENILDQNDVTVVDVGGKENFKKWIKLLRKYEIPFIILADHDVELGDLIDQNVCIKLDRELEDEIKKLGWERQEGEKIHPNEAYDFIKNLQEDKKEELFKSKIWEAVERTVKLARG